MHRTRDGHACSNHDPSCSIQQVHLATNSRQFVKHGACMHAYWIDRIMVLRASYSTYAFAPGRRGPKFAADDWHTCRAQAIASAAGRP